MQLVGTVVQEVWDGMNELQEDWRRGGVQILASLLGLRAPISPSSQVHYCSV